MINTKCIQIMVFWQECCYHHEKVLQRQSRRKAGLPKGWHFGHQKAQMVPGKKILKFCIINQNNHFYFPNFSFYKLSCLQDTSDSNLTDNFLNKNLVGFSFVFLSVFVFTFPYFICYSDLNHAILYIYCQGFDWSGLLDRSLKPPILPTVQGTSDTTNFDQFPRDLSVPKDEVT